MIFSYSTIHLPLTLLLSFLHSSIAHSHVECTVVDGEGCKGYARQYSYNKAGYVGTDQSKDRNYIVSAGLQNCPVTIQGVPEYTTDYPMGKVYPGQNVTLYWPPRGHSLQPHSQVWIYCSPDPGVQQPMVPSDTQLVATMPYSADCVGTDVSWSKCYGTFQIPTSWKQNETRTCQWVWTLNGALRYVDCFEYQVVDKATALAAPIVPPGSPNGTMITTPILPNIEHSSPNLVTNAGQIASNPVQANNTTTNSTLSASQEFFCKQIQEYICEDPTVPGCAYLLNSCNM